MLVAVMDGCSSGTDSHFASTLIAKILRKLAKQEAYREFLSKSTTSLSKLLERISTTLVEELAFLANYLDLRSDEVLSTMILGIINEENCSAELVVVGDGVIVVNDKVHEYENDNKPDYLGYHLKMDKFIWFATRTKKLSVLKFKSLSISTDGIYTFKNQDGKSYPSVSRDEIFSKFFKDTEHEGRSTMLTRTLIEVKEAFGQSPSDDFSVIRMIA